MTTTIAYMYLRTGLDRLGNIPTYATMMPTAHPTSAHPQKRMPRQQEEPYIAPILSNAIHRPHTMKVLGKKSNLDLVKHVKPLISPMAGIDAHQGYGRAQKKGLAYDPFRPIGIASGGPFVTGKLLTLQADSQYAGLNNRIPLPDF